MSGDGPRLHRVTLCAMQFYEIEVSASDRHAAFAIARGIPGEARLKFATQAEPVRAEILKMNNPADPSAGMEWVETRV